MERLWPAPAPSPPLPQSLPPAQRPKIRQRIPTSFICETVPQLTGTLKGDKAHPGIFDNTKIKRYVPEFKCQKPFRVGVRESVTWLRNHPEKQNLNPKVDGMCDQVVDAWRKAIS